MNNKLILLCFLCAFHLQLFAQSTTNEILRMTNPFARKARMEVEWTALQQSPPRLGVRNCSIHVILK